MFSKLRESFHKDGTEIMEQIAFYQFLHKDGTESMVQVVFTSPSIRTEMKSWNKLDFNSLSIRMKQIQGTGCILPFPTSGWI
jgi:hypothetical protein